MYRKFFAYNRRINKKNLTISAVLFVLIIIGGYVCLHQGTTIDNVKSYLSGIQFRSGLSQEEIEDFQIADISSKMSSFGEKIEDNTGKLSEEALSLEKVKEVLGAKTTTISPRLTLEEITERVNRVSKKVALVSIKTQMLVLEDITSQIAEQDLEQDTLEDISGRINQVSEQIELITLQLQQI
jgi:hypothetical protein